LGRDIEGIGARIVRFMDTSGEMKAPNAVLNWTHVSIALLYSRILGSLDAWIAPFQSPPFPQPSWEESFLSSAKAEREPVTNYVKSAGNGTFDPCDWIRSSSDTIRKDANARFLYTFAPKEPQILTICNMAPTRELPLQLLVPVDSLHPSSGSKTLPQLPQVEHGYNYIPPQNRRFEKANTKWKANQSPASQKPVTRFAAINLPASKKQSVQRALEGSPVSQIHRFVHRPR